MDNIEGDTKPALKKRRTRPVTRLTHAVADTHGRQDQAAEFPIVAVGASAGGLEAFSNLLQQLDGVESMALVLIQHLDPTRASLLREALAKTTTMAVVEAENHQRVEPNHVYVIAPNTCLGIRRGHLVLSARPDDPKAQHLPIDLFFGALAADRGSHAIGVVLSGTASDGTAGLKAIKEADGITFAQDPSSAKFEGMPRSAVEAGVVDYCLSIPAIAKELARLSRHPYLVASDQPPASHDAETRRQIFSILKEATRVDFAEYKSPTIDRRLTRRMALCRVDTLAAYLNVLREVPGEVAELYEDSLIHVTSFFRDEAAFELLKTHVFPALLRDKPVSAPIRVWVPGCSTGEEAYSLGIALVELVGTSARPIQIFASDVSAKTVEAARAGLYPDSAVRELSEERRRRHFTRVDGGYRIHKSIRDLCVFVQHDLARDPPFSKLDLVSCRNVLIYFDVPLQRRVVSMFHYALSQPGFLLLGRTENISSSKPLFQMVDKASKLFERTSALSTLRFAKRSDNLRPGTTTEPRRFERTVADSVPPLDLTRRIDRLLLARYAPPGVVVNDKLEILQFRGQTGAYLEPASGAPQNNLLQMARQGLPMVLRAAVAKAKAGAVPVHTAGVEVEHDGSRRECDVLVLPLLAASETGSPLYLVLFEQHLRVPELKGERPSASAQAAKADKRRLPRIEHELAATKEYLQTVITEHGRTNEDLGTANEELVSGNEELQSMNEELETAKEELQSINEELTTVNDELQSRNLEVSLANNDLVNLLTTVDIPLLILDSRRRIRRFTPKARSILNVLSTDVGRAFADIRPNLDVADLDRQVAQVIETMEASEAEVQDHEGHWYRLIIRPYKTSDNHIDGAVLSLFDIDKLKHLLEEARSANSDAERANRTKDEFLATLSHELRTPLTSILLRAQLLRRGVLADEFKIKKAAEAIEASVLMQVQLVDDLLDVSRIATGKLHMNLEPVDLGQVISVALEALTQSVERKQLRLEVDLSSRASRRQVYGDQTRLLQIVTNLVANAIKFTPAHGKVMVSLHADGESAVVRVQDTGIGISPSFIPKVFGRFTQANSTSTRAHGGLGLGLAIVRHLVELHHGIVAAESEGSGKGALFSVSLPLMKAARGSASLSKADARRADSSDATQLDGLRILVVDDDSATREAIAEMLGETGADVRLAQSSGDAMRAVEDFHPELLLCDIAMPDEDGYAFIRKLRARGVARSGSIPAVALTALAHDEDRARALAAGFQRHVTKPLDIDQLTRTIVELAAGHASAPSVNTQDSAEAVHGLTSSPAPTRSTET